jgi:hypothetical protein
MGPLVRDMLTARRRLEEVTGNYQRLRANIPSRQRRQVETQMSQAASAIRAANNLFRRWENDPASRHDKINIGWFSRTFRRAGRAAATVEARVERRMEPYRRAGAAVARRTERAARADIEPRPVDQPTVDDPGRDDWGIFMVGALGLGALILAGGLATGLASKGRPKKNPNARRCERELARQRRLLEG